MEDSPNMLLNMELKAPSKKYWIDRYDYDLAAQKVVELIYKYDIELKVMISSFRNYQL